MATIAFSEPLPPYAQHLTDIKIPPPSYDVAAAKAALDKLTPEERKKLDEGIASAIGSESMQPVLEHAAELAAGACKAIETMFTELRMTLVGIDQKYTTPKTEGFTPELTKLHDHYRKVVWDSQELATEIAYYAERFEDVIVPICVDTSVSIDKRKEKLNDFIKKAKEFETKTGDTKKSLLALKDRFTGFVGTFSSWAVDKEAKDNGDIKHLREEIVELQSKIAKIDSAILGLGLATGFTLPITGLLAAIFFPVAPVILAVGAAVAGVELSALVGLVAAKNVYVNDVSRKNGEIKTLQDGIEAIGATRHTLQQIGAADVKIFDSNVGALITVWQAAQTDAKKIQKWLNDGAQDADMPTILALQAGKVIGLYRSMARYLTAYANGVTKSAVDPNITQ